jgi:putative methyltransferase (TIGR04325 family)
MDFMGLPTRLKGIARALTPPFLWDVGRRVLGRSQARPRTFEGVYEDLAAIPGTRYYTERSLEDVYQRTRGSLENLHDQAGYLAARLDGMRQLLPFLLATLDGPGLKVVDFGGGMGLTYIDCLWTLHGLPDDYVIVDLPEVVEKARGIFPATYQVRFVDQVPRGATVDVVYIGGALQYVGDYEGILAELTSLNPRFVLIINTPMAAASTYATIQVNVRGRRIPCWIFDLKEIVQLMGALGYTLAFRSTNDVHLDFGDIDEHRRAHGSLNLLFVRRGGGINGTVGSTGRED